MKSEELEVKLTVLAEKVEKLEARITTWIKTKLYLSTSPVLYKLAGENETRHPLHYRFSGLNCIRA